MLMTNKIPVINRKHPSLINIKNLSTYNDDTVKIKFSNCTRKGQNLCTSNIALFISRFILDCVTLYY